MIFSQISLCGLLSVGGCAWTALADGVPGKDISKIASRLGDGAKWGDDGDEPTGQLGDECYRHDFCASNICSSGTFSSGVCVECLTHDDCDGHGESLPGTLPEAFCHENVCSKWKRGRPVSEDGYPVWWGHENVPPTYVKRKVHEGGMPTSLVWRFEVDNQVGGSATAGAFERNSTHIHVPLDMQLNAGYSMANPMVGEHESGIVTVFFGKNPISIVSPLAESGAGDKYHVLKYEGPLDETHKNRIDAELATRDERVNEQAANGQAHRTRLQALAVSQSNIGGMLLESQMDVVHLEKTRNHVKRMLDGEVPTQDVVVPEMSTEAKDALELAKRLPSLFSRNYCTHFETRDGLGYTDTHLVFPLNSPVVSLKGLSEFVPSHYFGLQAGIVVASHDVDANVLEFRFEFHQSGRMYPYEPNYRKNGLWLAPIDEANPVDPVDGRSDEFFEEGLDYSLLYNALFRRFLGIPIDYSVFDRSSTGTCDQETLDDLSDNWSDIDTEGNILNNLANQIGLLSLTTRGITCGSSFLKADAHEGYVGADILAFLVWGHLITEQGDASREEVCTATYWDDWDSFYKSQA